MFGYVSPAKCELKVRELEEYKAYYCGLCAAIGRHYTPLARISLTYDCAFLAILLSSVTEQAKLYAGHCPYKPLAKKKLIAQENPSIRYAAAINVLLAQGKLADDRRDGKGVTPALGSLAFRSAFKRAESDFPDAAAAIARGLYTLYTIEEDGAADPDEAADAFAAILADIARFAPDVPSEKKNALSRIGYDIGRWIYLIDALDDIVSDKKNGSYNVFVSNDTDIGRISDMLRMTLCDASKTLDELDPKNSVGIIRNVFELGCPNTSEKIINKYKLGADNASDRSPDGSL